MPRLGTTLLRATLCIGMELLKLAVLSVQTLEATYKAGASLAPERWRRGPRGSAHEKVRNAPPVPALVPRATADGQEQCNAIPSSAATCKCWTTTSSFHYCSPLVQLTSQCKCTGCCSTPKACYTCTALPSGLISAALCSLPHCIQ